MRSGRNAPATTCEQARGEDEQPPCLVRSCRRRTAAAAPNTSRRARPAVAAWLPPDAERDGPPARGPAARRRCRFMRDGAVGLRDSRCPSTAGASVFTSSAGRKSPALGTACACAARSERDHTSAATRRARRPVAPGSPAPSHDVLDDRGRSTWVSRTDAGAPRPRRPRPPGRGRRSVPRRSCRRTTSAAAARSR